MDQFAQYGHAILSVSLYAAIALVFNAATGIRKGGLNMAPGASHDTDYASFAFRLDRTYMNAVEVLGAFAAIVVAAILAGVNPFWVNLLAAICLVLRVFYSIVFLRGIGAGYGGLRTVLSALASLAMLALVVMTAVAVLGWAGA